MNKVLLERFISKYNLSGATEAVKWVAGSSGLKIDFVTGNKDAVGFVDTKLIQMTAGEYNIFETAKIKTLLAVIKDDMTFEVKSTAKGPYAFHFKDDSVKVLFALSDSSVVPSIPSMKTLPEPDIVFNIDQKFRETFVKAKGALSEEELFAVVSDGSTAQIILGYDADSNKTNISIDLNAQKLTKLEPITFNAALFKEILQANKEMTTGIVSVSSKGVTKVGFNSDEFAVEYYLFKKVA